MSLFANLSFATPWILAALAALPLIYWLLRVTPPPPRRQIFPPLRLLLGLSAREETPARTPVWLLLLRLLIAALFVTALAEPMLGQRKMSAQQGPLVLFVDNGWTAAHGWQARQDAMTDALRGTARDGRAVAVIATADPHPVASLLDSAAAGRAIAAMKPQSWLADRKSAVDALVKIKFTAKPDILWLSDGLDRGDAISAAAHLSQIGKLRILADAVGKTALALLPPANTVNGFSLSVRRVSVSAKRGGKIEALGKRGELLAETPFVFTSGATQANAKLSLPLEMRNKTGRIAIADENSAGGVQLLDSGNQRRAVGLVSAGGNETEQPLLSDLYYLERALSPYADLHKGTITNVLQRDVSVLVLADIGRIAGADRDRVARFVKDGGMLIRFAGARMTENIDDLIPVRLRSGGRYLGGAMAWSAPQHLAAFPENSPFAAVAVPHEVTVSRQVLAEPSIELGDRTWARLADGTPLVTAEHHGKGWIVLFHVTASPAWSSLPLSGLYVDMLRRLLELSGANATQTGVAKAASYPPMETLDGFGISHKASPDILPLRAVELAHARPTAAHPAGYYGVEGSEIALNAVSADFKFTPFAGLAVPVETYAATAIIALAPILIALAFLLLLIDTIISLNLRGYLDRPMRMIPRGAGVVLIAGLAIQPRAAHADNSFALQAALDTRLAYVRTGLTDVDAMSKAGLVGLDVALTQRTSYEPQQPLAVDLDKDELSFFPLLYWPMDPREKDLSPKAIAKIADYMRNGGTILFDTRDLTLGAVQGPQSVGQQTLRRLVAKLDLPPLQVVPRDHVLTKAFYLLQDFPGRWDGGKVWVEALPPPDPGAGPAPARGGDGVSPVIIGGNDWAAAWAVDNQGRPLVEPVPGGERQREMAYRFGVNLVMYAFTGNYKTDQVHVPALLERLGQ